MNESYDIKRRSLRQKLFQIILTVPITQYSVQGKPRFRKYNDLTKTANL